MNQSKVYVKKEENGYHNIFKTYTFFDSNGQEIVKQEGINTTDEEAIASFKRTFGWIPEIAQAQIVMMH